MEVFTLLDKVKEKPEPFFIFIKYMDAHDPYIPPPPFDNLYPGKDVTFSLSRYYRIRVKVMRLERKVTEKERLHMISQYDGGIAYIDFHIGKLIIRLKELGLYDKTMIIITSDHGKAFGERNLIRHGVSVYQNQVYIPLIIKYPNIRKGHKVGELVNSIDIMPTILDVSGCETPEYVQGQSLLKLEPEKSRNVINESYLNVSFLGSRFQRVERAIFSGPYKFISSTAGKRELYNLSKDPEEKENIYHADDPVSMALETRLNRWLDTIVTETDSPAKLDKKALESLKALGYIQ